MRALFATIALTILSLQATATPLEEGSLFAKIAVKKANFRAMPSLKGSIIDKLYRGDIVVIVDKPQDGFYPASNQKGANGWVHQSVIAPAFDRKALQAPMP